MRKPPLGVKRTATKYCVGLSRSLRQAIIFEVESFPVKVKEHMDSASMIILAKGVIVALALAGFLIASYIWRKKRRSETLVCPIGANCEAVVHSQHSRFFGIHVEVLGMAYYFVIATIYFLFIAIPSLISPLISLLILVATTGALFFSVYLTFIQVFTLRQFCSWCLTSASISLAIFFLAIPSAPPNLIDMLRQYREILLLLHGLAVIFGFGGAVVTDALFFKFLKDSRISEEEAGVLHHVSQVIWFALAVIVLTGLGLVLSDWMRLVSSPKFLAKITIVAIIIINGTTLHFLVKPRLVNIFFGKLPHANMPESRIVRRIAFALGSVSSTSWLSAFVLGSLSALDVSYWLIMAIYALALTGAISSSQALEFYLARRS